MSGDLQLNLHDAITVERLGVIAIGPMNCYRISPITFHSFQAHNVTWAMEVSTYHDDKDVIRLQESRKLEP